MKNKKAVFFSADALIAIVLIFLTVLVVYPTVRYSEKKDYSESDLIRVLSSIKIGEVNDNYTRILISEGKISDLNKTLLEQIGEFYVTNITIARELTNSLLLDLDIKDNIGLYFNQDRIFIRNTSSIEYAKNIRTDRQSISGISQGDSTTGYSARAFLSSQMQTSYFYFGGYLGEGNISINVNYSGILERIEMEIAINKDFDVYINNNFSGHYTNSTSEFTPKNYNDLNAYTTNFHSGNNIIKIVGNATSFNTHIAGGYIKLTYSNASNYETPTRYYFPGIEGIINEYDGFYVPGNINQMNIFIKMNSNVTTFLNIGNVTVFKNSTNGTDKNFLISNTYLSNALNYSQLSNKNIPIRFAIENISYIMINKKDIDVFSVNDLSGSMISTSCKGVTCGKTRCCGSSCGLCTNNKAKCQSCGGTYLDKFQSSKDATKIFIDSILNISINDSVKRAGVVGYNDSFSYNSYYNLSNDSTALKAEVDSWKAAGNTCVCCGINKAVDDLRNYSLSNKSRSIIVMSDGQANVKCARQGTSTAKNDAIQAACQAYNNYGIKVSAVGFGSDSDNVTMQAIANCGHGTYYWGDIEGIIDIYKQIAEDVIEGSYKEQTAETFGNSKTILYPDSFIEYNYIPQELPYGVIITNEILFTNSTFGSFNIPDNSTIVETRVISYSGPRWTQYVKINNDTVYNISKYNFNYTLLGDPYTINIPNSLVKTFNNITLTTGLSSINSSNGSLSNKIIYKIIKNMSSYSPIYPHANGCKWSIEFEDNSIMNFSVPKDYIGPYLCYYRSDKHELGDTNDAISFAVNNLLKLLDLDSDYKVDVMISNQSLDISSSQITGIPFTWSSKVEVIKWD